MEVLLNGGLFIDTHVLDVTDSSKGVRVEGTIAPSVSHSGMKIDDSNSSVTLTL